jgi:signal peptidase I
MKGFSTRIYTGNSMCPLFRPGDGLVVEPVEFGRLRPGDVVVFREEQDPEFERVETRAQRQPQAIWPPTAVAGPRRVVHRVMAVRPEGLVARGDANPRADEGFVTADRLEGLVTGLERRRRPVSVHGGRRGFADAAIARIVHRTWRYIKRFASLPYALVRASGLAKFIWNPQLRTISLRTPQGPLIKTRCGKHTVARWWPRSGRFECRKPYDLVIERPDGREATS